MSPKNPPTKGATALIIAISIKTTRDSQGVQVLNSKKDSKMIKIKPLSEIEFSDTEYYRTKNIPATGCYLKEEDKFTQFSL